MPAQDEPPTRPWYAPRLSVVLELVAVGMIALALLAAIVVRERLARVPEIGRATPIEELRAAWAEADREAGRTARAVPMTHPNFPRTEPRP